MAWSDIFIPDGFQTADEAQSNADAQSAKLAAQDAARVANGTISDATLARDNAAIGAAKGFATAQNSAASDGFVSGLKDGWTKFKDAVTGWGPFKLVPFWIWVVAAIAAFFYFGGFGWIKRFKKS